jgi:hypothetical protein
MPSSRRKRENAPGGATADGREIAKRREDSMTWPRSFGVMSLAVLLAGCGGSKAPSQPTVRTVLRLSVSQQVTAVPSTDPRYAAEALIDMAATETAGVTAYINGFTVKATDEASGAVSYPQVVRLNTTSTIPAGGSVALPFRVLLAGSGTYRARVSLRVTDAGGPVGTVPTGGVAADGTGSYTGEATTFESPEIRILTLP